MYRGGEATPTEHHRSRSPRRRSAIATAATDAPAGTISRWVLVATILGSSMVFIDGSVVNVALPTLQRELGASAASTQ